MSWNATEANAIGAGMMRPSHASCDGSDAGALEKLLEHNRFDHRQLE